MIWACRSHGHLLWPAGDDAGFGRQVGRASTPPPDRPRLCDQNRPRNRILWRVGSSATDGREQVWMSHGDHVSKIAPGFEVWHISGHALCDHRRCKPPLLCGAIPPEVHHTPMARSCIKTAGHCRLSGRWTMAGYRRQAVAAIREQVGACQGDLRAFGRC